MTYSKTSISPTNVDAFLWTVTLAVQKYCACSISTAESLTGDLEWYIRTGRATPEFLRKLVRSKPFMIARRIAHGGSTDEGVARIKDYVDSIECERSDLHEHLP